MKLGVRGLAFNTPKPVVRRAMFWGSRQLLELISHSWRERFFLEGRDLCFRFHQYRCLKLTLRSGRVLAVALMHSLLRGRYLTSKRGNERHLKLVKLQQKKPCGLKGNGYLSKILSHRAQTVLHAKLGKFQQILLTQVSIQLRDWRLLSQKIVKGKDEIHQTHSQGKKMEILTIPVKLASLSHFQEPPFSRMQI